MDAPGIAMFSELNTEPLSSNPFDVSEVAGHACTVARAPRPGVTPLSERDLRLAMYEISADGGSQQIALPATKGGQPLLVPHAPTSRKRPAAVGVLD